MFTWLIFRSFSSRMLRINYAPIKSPRRILKLHGPIIFFVRHEKYCCNCVEVPPTFVTSSGEAWREIESKLIRMFHWAVGNELTKEVIGQILSKWTLFPFSAFKWECVYHFLSTLIWNQMINVVFACENCRFSQLPPFEGILRSLTSLLRQNEGLVLNYRVHVGPYGRHVVQYVAGIWRKLSLIYFTDHRRSTHT